MKRTTEPDVIERLRAADPIDDAEIRNSVDPESRNAVLRGAIQLGTEADSELRSHRRRLLEGRGRPALAVAAIVAAALAAILVLGGDSITPGQGTAYARSVVQAAEGSPRLLIGAPGWHVTRADQFKPDEGEIEFSDGQDHIRVLWEPAANYFPSSSFHPGQWFQLPVSGCPPDENGKYDQSGNCKYFARSTRITVLGDPAHLDETLNTSDGKGSSTDFTATLPPSGGSYVAIEAYGIDKSKYLDALDSIYETDVDSWLSALPPETVKPLERPEVVDEMLKGIPLPPGLDPEELKGQPEALSRYQLGAAVTGAVSCGWLDQWAEATRTGDNAAAAQATDAMSTSRDWPILKEMASAGGWSQVVWEYAADMHDGDRDALLGSSGTVNTPDGSVYELRPSYASGLGCDSQRRILIDKKDPSQHPLGFNPTPVSDAMIANAVAESGPAEGGTP